MCPLDSKNSVSRVNYSFAAPWLACSALQRTVGPSPVVSLQPPFDPATYAYTVLEAVGTQQVHVTPEAAGVGATITVNGKVVDSGSSSDGIDVKRGGGNTTITVGVKAQDGKTTQTYTIQASVEPSSDASLAVLSLTDGSLEPAFASDVFSYTAVEQDVGKVGVTAKLSDAGGASLTVQGESVDSGKTTTVELDSRTTSVEMRVTAEDGKTTQSYTAVLTLLGSNALLSGLEVLNLASLDASDYGGVVVNWAVLYI